MMDAPERIWASPEHPDENGYGGFWIKTKVAPAVEYVRSDLVKNLEAIVARSVGLLGDAYNRERTQAAQLQEAREIVRTFIAREVDYMTINKLGDPEKQQMVQWGRAFLAKSR
jgi:hypothetical protein